MTQILRRLTQWPLVAILVCLTTALSLRAERAGAQAADAGPPFIEATGMGESRAAPDRATVTLSVETKAASAAAASVANARIQRGVLDTLAKLGLKPPAVSTESFNVAPNYEAGERGARQVGYIARNSVSVRVADLARIGAVIDAALARGATGVSDVEFASSAADSAHRAAVREAAQKAHAQAAAIADALGGSLGSLLQATTSSLGGDTFISRRLSLRRSEVENTPITPSDVLVGAMITARWQFLQKR